VGTAANHLGIDDNRRKSWLPFMQMGLDPLAIQTPPVAVELCEQLNDGIALSDYRPTHFCLYISS
jgi:hypothetical protein